MLLGGLTSFLYHSIASIFLLDNSLPPSAGNMAARSWLHEPHFCASDRYIDMEYIGRITGSGPWIKDEDAARKKIFNSSSTKLGSDERTIEATFVTANEKIAGFVENTGRLVRYEIDKSSFIELFCTHPLKNVWTDSTGDIVLAQDERGSFYAFEGIGESIK